MQRTVLQHRLSLYNTASRTVEPFTPIAPPRVSMYNCGMTVYYLPHIGHLRTYTTSDLLRRVLEYAGYEVRQVMNVTDVGHMTSDADEGDDKIEVGARREGRSPWELARQYEAQFFAALAEANILHPHVICRATEHIPEQIALIQRLEERGFTYRTSVGVIFDTGKFPGYADFARLDLAGQEAGARVTVDAERRHPQDFALWITNQPAHLMQWDSPWGRGFPGWHLECSAMAFRYLGETLDIHTGGIDHIPVHHTNEIAQSEAAFGKPFTRCWVHTAFLNVDGQKMSKSLGNLYTLDDLRMRGFHPLALRYYFLGSSYHTAQNFTWDGLDGAQRALLHIWDACAALPAPGIAPVDEYLALFDDALADDLNTARALGVLQRLLQADISGPEKAATVFVMDRVLGLDLANARTCLHDAWRLNGITPEVEAQAWSLVRQRQQARDARDFARADGLRTEILQLGYRVEDSTEGVRLRPVLRFERR